MLEQLTGIIIHLIASFGYFGVGFLTTLNSMGIPIPSEITLPFAGFLSNQGSLTLVLVILAGIVGDLIGALIGYSIGFFLEETVVLSFIRKYGKIILLTEEDYLKTTKWLKKYGSPVVFVGKLIPGVKSFVSIAAGLSEIKLHKFIMSTILGALVYVSLLSYVGFYLGSKWSTVGVYVKKFELLIVVVLVLGVLWYVNHKLKLVKLPRLR